jgi:dsRNA-specific ribonuclease
MAAIGSLGLRAAAAGRAISRAAPAVGAAAVAGRFGGMRADIGLPAKRWQSTDSPHFAWHPESEHNFQYELFELQPPTPELNREMSAFMARLELEFKDVDLLLLAATDSSYPEGSTSNGRIAVLGKSIMRSALFEFLYVRYPNLPGDVITDTVAALTGDEVLWKAACNIGAPYLVRSKDSVTAVGAYSPATVEIVNQAFAGVVGAVFLDQGTQAASEYALDMLVPVLEHSGVEAFAKMANPKATLARLLADEGFAEPRYTIIQETGRHTHQPTFLVGVFSGDKELADGASYSIELAQEQAARSALLSRYAEEFEGYELPSSWGAYSVADVEGYVVDMHEGEDEGDEPEPKV